MVAIITTFEKACKIVQKVKKEGKKVGLITGCFDIIHFGYVETIKFANKHCNFLVIGLDSDKTININKGIYRPIFAFKYRSRVLSELKSIDLIFQIKEMYKFD